MKFLFSLLLLASLRLGAETMPAQVLIGFGPNYNPMALSRGTKVLTDELSKQIGVPVKPVLAKSYAELIGLVADKKIDFAFLSSQTFVEVEKKYGVKVLLKKVWNESFYYSVILANDKAKIKKLSDLKNKRLGFVDQNSTSGYLYPKVGLKKAGLSEKDLKEVVFSGSHPESVALLENGKVDAIAVFSDDVEGQRTAWLKFHTKDQIKVHKVWISEAIPNDPFCVRQDFYDKNPKLTHTLMFALIDAAEGLQKDNDVKALLGAHGFQPATSRQYDAVREMIQTLGPDIQ